MTAQILDGKTVAAQKLASLTTTLNNRKTHGMAPVQLAVILVGSDPASIIYVRNKEHACQQVGIISKKFPLPASVTHIQLLELIYQLNHDPEIDGILVQLPLPATIDTAVIIEAINPLKDVDGFHPYNIGCLALRKPSLRPCTPKGIMSLLSYYHLPTKGQNVTIVGASNIVGRPMALEMLLVGATVTVCHRFSHDLIEHLQNADIVIAAAGKPYLIHGDSLKEEAIVIDVGISRLANGKLVGDIDFKSACQRVKWITPVPGGVGPMTVVSLLENTLQARLLRESD